MASPGFLMVGPAGSPFPLTLIPRDPGSPGETCPLAKSVHREVFTLSTPKTRKMKWINVPKTIKIIVVVGGLLSLPLLEWRLGQEDVMVFEMGAHHSPRLWLQNKSLSFCTSTCLTSFAFIVAGSGRKPNLGFWLNYCSNNH